MIFIKHEGETDEKASVSLWTSEISNVEIVNESTREAQFVSAYDNSRITGFVVSEVPVEPVPPKYMRMVLYVNPATLELWWEPVSRELTAEEKMELVLEKNKTADQRYHELNLTATPLDQLKKAKTDQLNEACEAAILRGFTSATTGHFYAFGTHDQTNFTQQMLLLIADPGAAEVSWKTEKTGIVTHTRDEFLSICTEAEQHKRVHVRRYWQLKADVAAAATWQEVDEIVWS